MRTHRIPKGQKQNINFSHANRNHPKISKVEPNLEGITNNSSHATKVTPQMVYDFSRAAGNISPINHEAPERDLANVIQLGKSVAGNPGQFLLGEKWNPVTKIAATYLLWASLAGSTGAVLSACGIDDLDHRPVPTAPAPDPTTDQGTDQIKDLETFMSTTFTPNSKGNLTVFLPVSSIGYQGLNLAAGSYLINPRIPSRLDSIPTASNPNLGNSPNDSQFSQELVEILLRGYFGQYSEGKKKVFALDKRVKDSLNADSLLQMLKDYTDQIEGGDLGLSSSWETDVNNSKNPKLSNFATTPIGITLGSYTGSTEDYLALGSATKNQDANLSRFTLYIRHGVNKRAITIYLERKDAEELMTAYGSPLNPGLVNKAVEDVAKYNLGLEEGQSKNKLPEADKLKPNEILAQSKFM